MNLIIFIVSSSFFLSPVINKYRAYSEYNENLNAIPNKIDELSDIQLRCSKNSMEKRNGIYSIKPKQDGNLYLEVQILPLSDAIPDTVLCTYDKYNEKTSKRDSDYEAMSIVRAQLKPFSIIRVNLDDSTPPIFTRVSYIIKDSVQYQYIILTEGDCYYIDYLNEEFYTLKRGVNDW